MAWSGAEINGRRVVIVGGLRTPFLEAGGAFRDISALDLAKAVVTELVQRMDLEGGDVDQVVFGQVVSSPRVPNIAREVVLGTPLPRAIDAYTISRGCASGTQALISGCQSILLGEADVVLCGGAESVSRPQMTLRPPVIDALQRAGAASDAWSKARALLDIQVKHLRSEEPESREPSTGLTVARAAETTARNAGIKRSEQDAFAARSHGRAADAWERGVFDEEVMSLPIPPALSEVVRRDALVDRDIEEKLASLSPVADDAYGTVTEGNMCRPADGAGAVVLMSEERAEALGYAPLAFVRSWASAAVDPASRPLMGSVLACEEALRRAGLELSAVDLIDIHETSAGQVLANAMALAAHAREAPDAGENGARIPDEKLNVFGGSLALGHPFAATGVRQALTMSRELQRRGGGTALVTQCAPGGLGSAVVFHHPPHHRKE